MREVLYPNCPMSAVLVAVLGPIAKMSESAKAAAAAAVSIRRTLDEAAGLDVRVSTTSASLSGGLIDMLVGAAFVGDLSDVERAVGMAESSFNLDERSPLECNRSALQAAAEGGRAAVARFLLLAGASPDLQDARCWTPLHHAAMRGHLETCEVLLAHGASAGARAMFTSVEVPRFCVSRYARFLLQLCCGPTPRAFAADPRVRQLLLKYEIAQLVRLRTPRPLASWRHELRCSDSTEEQCALALLVPGWLKTAARDPRRRRGYKKQTGLGFGGGTELPEEIPPSFPGRYGVGAEQPLPAASEPADAEPPTVEATLEQLAKTVEARVEASKAKEVTTSSG